jgi:plastocyanin
MRTHPYVIALLIAGLAAAGCGEAETAAAPEPAEPAGTVLKVAAKPSGSGAYRFDAERLEAKAGLVAIEFDNRDEFAHNVRIQTGAKCCFKDGSTDVGGTDTTNGGTVVKGTARLEPGRYVFLCSIGGHYDGETGKMRGTLLVR